MTTERDIDKILSVVAKAIDKVTQVINLGEVAVPRGPYQVAAFELADPKNAIRGMHLQREVRLPRAP